MEKESAFSRLFVVQNNFNLQTNRNLIKDRVNLCEMKFHKIFLGHPNETYDIWRIRVFTEYLENVITNL